MTISTMRLGTDMAPSMGHTPNQPMGHNLNSFPNFSLLREMSFKLTQIFLDNHVTTPFPIVISNKRDLYSLLTLHTLIRASFAYL